MKRFILTGLFSFLILFSIAQKQQKQRNYTLNGYLEGMGTVWIQDFDRQWYTQSTIINRLDFRWYPHKNLKVHIGMRNIINYGQMVYDFYPLYHDISVFDYGWVDMTFSVVNDSSVFMFTNIDRANIKYNKGNFETIIGRQRINWGINMVWNPNDIFNTYDYFAFNYIERPGCDAIRVQYYTGMVSSIDFGFKVDYNGKVTSAAMYKFNRGGYDIQFLGGYMVGDVVLGTGWSGQIKGAGFNGELSYFHSAENFGDSIGEVVASVGLNYAFRFGLTLDFAGLLNTAGTTGPASMGPAFVLRRQLSAKYFTRARYSTFGSATYMVSPLITATLAGMWNPTDKSAYIGPTIDFSLTQNISLMGLAQIFIGNPGTEFGDYGSMYFILLKWSF